MNIIPMPKRDWVSEVLSLVEEGESSFWKAAVIMQRQVADGMSQRQMAKELGKSKTWVQNHLAWAEPAVSATDHHPRLLANKTQPSNTKRKTPFSGQGPKKRKAPKQSAAPDPIDLIQEPCPDCETQQQFWQTSLANVAGDAISMEAFWTKQFGDWEEFEVPSTHVTLAKQASEAWIKLASKIAKMGGSRGKA